MSNPLEQLNRGIALAMDDFQRQQRGEPPNPDPTPRLVTVGVCAECAAVEPGDGAKSWAVEVARCKTLVEDEQREKLQRLEAAFPPGTPTGDWVASLRRDRG